MATDFVVLALSLLSKPQSVNDICGRPIDIPSDKRSIIFFHNVQNIHWNLIHIKFHPIPELQLFEPIGKPSMSRRGRSLGFRSIPRTLISWLDFSFPLDGKKSWIEISRSAITNQQQLTPYDCGIACLLYAEKCGQGQVNWLLLIYCI
jgi:hypothetical protein